MRRTTVIATGLITTLLLLAGLASAQTRTLSDSECQSLRARLAGHARQSEGVRRLLAAVPAVAAAPSAAVPATGGRGDAIRARLAQIPAARQALETQRLNAAMKFDLSAAAKFQGDIQALDQERAALEKELTGLPAATPAPAPTPVPAAGSDVDRVRCQDMTATLDSAVKIRQKELGAREGQSGAIPLLALTASTPAQIARDLAAQFAAWPGAAAQVGLLDQDGDGRLDGFVDVPADGVFRLYRQRADGTLVIDAFSMGATAAYGETTRRLEETLARQSGVTLADLLARRPAGPVRVVGESADFASTFGSYLAGDFAETARREGAVRSREFANLRGETLRVTELIAPVAGGGVMLRHVIVGPRPNDQELWEEVTTTVKAVSYFQTDVESVVAKETRTSAGAVAVARTTSAPIRFRLER
jgi:hypothetical protein